MDKLIQFFSSISPSMFSSILVLALVFFGIAWWLKSTIARERKRDIDEIRDEVTGVIGPALDKIVHILEKQDEINRDLLGQNKITRLLGGKSEDDLE